jgi:hypothetical protein
MNLTILAVPDCPNLALLEQRLHTALAGRHDISITRHMIANEDQAARHGMHGSPTLLVDGTDPFAARSQSTGLSCRLYHTENGIEGAPSLPALCRVLGKE